MTLVPSIICDFTGSAPDIVCRPDARQKDVADKAALRAALIAQRRGVGKQEKMAWDGAIAEQVLTWCIANKVQSLGIYWPMRGEPDLRPLYIELASRNVRLALPVVIGQQSPLVFAAWAPNDPMVRDAMGAAIPARIDEISRLDAVLIPCVGFNAQRCRLGYGGGFYDRTLAQSPRPLALGIAYACLEAQFSAEEHDVALDVIITECAE